MSAESPTKDLFFEDLARIFDAYVSSITDALTKSTVQGALKYKIETYARLRQCTINANLTPADIRPVAEDIVEGVLHSVLAIFDGSTALWETTTIDLIDPAGEALGGSLTNEFFAYLTRTGRVKGPKSKQPVRH